MTTEAKFRVRSARGCTAFVTSGDYRYCVTWDWRPARNEVEFTLWSPEGRKVTTMFDGTLTPHVREAMKAATLDDIERRKNITILAAP